MRTTHRLAVLVAALLHFVVGFPISARAETRERAVGGVSILFMKADEGIQAICDGPGPRLLVEVRIVEDRVISIVRDDKGLPITRVVIPAFRLSAIESVGDFGAHFVAAIELSAREAMSLPSIPDYEEAYLAGLPSLWEQTQALGNTVLRQSLLMHLSVLSVAKATASGQSPKCTLCPESGMGVPFHCSEDHGTAAPLAPEASDNSADPEIGIFFCWPLQGSDCGCCGNYSGACYYCDTLCLAHDVACESCSPSWFCLSGCVPGSCFGLVASQPGGDVFTVRKSLHPRIVGPPISAAGQGSDRDDTATSSEAGRLAPAIEMGNPFPNPSRSGVAIQFVLPRETESSLRIYNLSGALVKTLVERRLDAGSHVVQWDRSTDGGRQADPGVYFCEFRTDGMRLSRRIVMLH